MAEFLSSTSHIVSRMEDAVSQSKEYVYFMTPSLLEVPHSLSSVLTQAIGRRIKLVVIFREHAIEGIQIPLFQNSTISIFQCATLNTNLCLTDKEGIISSHNIFSPSADAKIEFGTYFRKSYAAEMHLAVLEEFRKVWGDSVKMVFDDGKLVSYESVLAKKSVEAKAKVEVKVAEPGEAYVMLTKKLTVKEKQNVILKTFARAYENCAIKVEDAERLRVVGQGMVLNLSVDRVDLIFVHYETFQSRLEEIKEFVTTRHPELNFWFQYNRINMQLQYEKDIVAVFQTIQSLVSEFKLINVGS